MTMKDLFEEHFGDYLIPTEKGAEFDQLIYEWNKLVRDAYDAKRQVETNRK